MINGWDRHGGLDDEQAPMVSSTSRRQQASTRLASRPRPARRLGAHVRTLFATDGPAIRQGLVALALNSSTSLVAGAVLGSLTNTFERLPGLLVLVPAAIGLRGNVFSAFGSRLSTSIHTGSFRMSLRPGSILGDNVAAALLLTSGLSLALAFVAKGVAVAFGVPGTISVLDLATISIIGGLLASVVVLGATVALTAGAVRFGWDLDNLVAPLVSTLGDVLTLPALWLASGLVGRGAVSGAIGWILATASATGIAFGWATRRALLRQIARQSWPVLAAALVLSTFAGVVIERQFETFLSFPALLILVPAFVSSAGALGGILTSRLSTQLHLGTLQPARVPPASVRHDAGLLAALAVPVYVFNAAGAHVVARMLGDASPGIGWMIAAALTGGTGAVLFVIAVAYYGSVAAVKLNVDPDTYGIPIVTSSVDFVGALALILAIVGLGIA
jgi:mgtE-like transporter